MIKWNEEIGYAVIPSFLPAQKLSDLIIEAERLFAEDGRRSAGVRRVVPRSRIFRSIAQSRSIMQHIEPILGESAFVVRSILFDKSPDANWDVGWHQDTTIAVSERIETPGYGPWSIKVGVVHVRPPARVLERMLTLRLHLDRCSIDNGPLLVAPGSHRNGILFESPDYDALERSSARCITDAGGVVLMRPLLFHASRKARAPSHRRVLHLEFASEQLDPPLKWAAA